MKLPKSLIFAVVAVILLIARSAHAQSDLVLLVSQPGDYIGQGQTYVTQDTNSLSVSGTPTMIITYAFGFTFWIGGPGGTNLTVGLYTNSARFNDSHPGLDIYGNGRGCDGDCGSFQIYELHTNVSGQVDRLWVAFTNRCECGTAPMTGEIRYNSQLAPAAPAPRTLRVPADYPTIQVAMNAANVLAIDTVLVSPGIYNESVSFNGKTVRLLSLAGPAATWIVPPYGHSAVAFDGGETTNSVLSGFTLTNAYNAGVSVYNSSPIIVSNVIVGCQTGIYCDYASPVILSNFISNCYGVAIDFYWDSNGSSLIKGNVLLHNAGGGVYVYDGNSVVTILDNLIQANYGDGINVEYQSGATIAQNIIARNNGNGIFAYDFYGGTNACLINNTIVGNGGAGIYAGGYDYAYGSGFSGPVIAGNIVSGSPALNYNVYFVYGNNPSPIQANDFFSPTGDVLNGGTFPSLGCLPGNISTNPFFACLPSADYHLLPGSSCIDAGANGAPFLPSVDFDGNPRILAGQTNGPALVDMGAFEFNPAHAPSPCLYLTVSSNVVVVAAVGQNSALATYPAPDATPSATVTSLPSSGSVFPAGTNVVVCTMTYGSNVLTGSFDVIVKVPPYVTNQPTVITAVAGTNVILSIGALGTGPMTYQWWFSDMPVTNTTAGALTLSNVQSENGGYYQVTLANDVGSAVSAPILLRVLPSRAAIVSVPSPVTVSAGNPAVFNCTVIGSAPLSVQWYKDAALLPGANSADLIIPNAQASDAGTYQIAVSNSLASAFSSGAYLTVLPAKPAFVLQPVSTAGVAGTNVTFTSLAAGTDNGLDPIRYVWYFQNQNLAGQTSPTLALPSITAANQGAYFVVATNSMGAATSHVAQLTVYLPPAIQTGLSNLVVDFGTTATLSVTVTGTPPFAYNWSFNGSSLSNATASLTLTNVQLPQSGYYSLTVSNLYGRVFAAGRLSVFLPASSLAAWGDDSGGQTDVPTNLDDVVAVAGGDYHSVALRHDGTLVAWGYDGDGQTDVPTNALRFVSIAAGADHNLAITENGCVVAWGRNDFGQTNVPYFAFPALSVAAGDSHSLALLASGKILTWGDNSFGQTSVPYALNPGYGFPGNPFPIYPSPIYPFPINPIPITPINPFPGFPWPFYPLPIYIQPIYIQPISPYPIYLNPIEPTSVVTAQTDFTIIGWYPFWQTLSARAIAAGRNHSLALLQDGTVVGWGDNGFGQALPPAGLSNVVAIAAGDLHSAALRSDGTAVVWGDNTFGETNVPVGLSNVVAIAAGDFHTIALQANGTVVGWGDDTFGELDPPAGITHPLAIASGYYHGLALTPFDWHLQGLLTRDGMVMRWNGTATLQWAPTPAGPYTDVPCGGNSWTNTDLSTPARFFRLRR